MSLLLLLFYTLLWITLILIVDKFVEFMKDVVEYFFVCEIITVPLHVHD